MPSVPYTAIAQYPYTPSQENADDDLAFDVGQKIKVTEIVDESWLYGSYQDKAGVAKSGYFPKAFVKEAGEEVKSSEIKQEQANDSTDVKKEEPTEIKEPAQNEPEVKPEVESNEAKPAEIKEPSKEVDKESTKKQAEDAKEPVKKELSEDTISSPTPVEASPVEAAPVKQLPVKAAPVKSLPVKASPSPTKHTSSMASAFKKKLNAFNTESSPPPVPGKVPEQSFVRRGFIAASKKSSYVPPPIKEEKIVRKLSISDKKPDFVAEDTAHEEKERAEDAAPKMTLKERMKILEERQMEEQKAMRAAMERREQKKRERMAELHAKAEADTPADTEEPEEGKFEDAEEETAEPEAKEGQTEESKSEDEEEKDEEDEEEEESVEESEETDEDDEEMKRRRLRERMAKLSGGMGMMGMLGMKDFSKPEKKKKHRSLKRAKTQEEKELEAMPAAIPIMPFARDMVKKDEQKVADKPSDDAPDEDVKDKADSEPATESKDETVQPEKVSSSSEKTPVTPKKPASSEKSVPSTPSTKVPKIPAIPTPSVPTSSKTETPEPPAPEAASVPPAPSTPAIPPVPTNSSPMTPAPQSPQAPQPPEHQVPVMPGHRTAQQVPEHPSVPSMPYTRPPPMPPVPGETDDEVVRIVPNEQAQREVEMERRRQLEPTRTTQSQVSEPSVPPPAPVDRPAPPVPTGVPSGNVNRMPAPPTPLPRTTSSDLPPPPAPPAPPAAPVAPTAHARTMPMTALPPPPPVPVEAEENTSPAFTNPPVARTMTGLSRRGSVVSIEQAVGNDTNAWWATRSLPPALNGKSIYFETEQHEISKRYGRIVRYIDYYILSPDLSSQVWELAYESKDPTKLLSYSQTKIARPRPDHSYLASASESLGAAACHTASKMVGHRVDDLAGSVIARLPRDVLPPVAGKTFGVAIYKNNSNVDIRKMDEIEPGDVVVVVKGRFEGSSHLLKSKKVKEIGFDKPYVGIVTSFDEQKGKLKVVEATDGVARTSSLKLGEFKAGKLRIFRIVDRKCIGW